MSKIKNEKVDGFRFNIEEYDSAMEVVEKCKSRTRTCSSFHDMENYSISMSWHGVESYDKALELMKTGYQPTVEKLRSALKVTKSGEGTRFSFRNEIQGFAPVVPLALKGVPNCMINMSMKPIKAKVIDVYYDVGASWGHSSDEIIEAGQKFLASVVELERQGYRFNLYAVQTYSDSNSTDMLVVRVKRDSQPLDLKRVSFPLTHTGFFRVIGFDWYSKVPGGKYRCAYGSALAYNLSKSKRGEAAKKLFGNNAVYISAAEINDKDEEHIKEVLTNDSTAK